MSTFTMSTLDSRLADALGECGVDQKLAKVAALALDWRQGKLPAAPRIPVALTVGRPEKPDLVSHHQVPQRGPKSPEGRAALIHAIAHIEFSAINLALDHAARFPGMPAEYVGDWIGVADEEAYHFRLLRDHLRTYGFDYGSFPAHQGLQQMAERTTDDVLARMALVPRLLEARGLDATPPIQAKLKQAGDDEAV
ncbi:MAG TPA: ferritin-like domain-containing protein, partial [Rhodocyclaceae bacterium]|nr:ferritin-like domain-containing protein [Rhodocyclaceae bacterium]